MWKWNTNGRTANMLSHPLFFVFLKCYNREHSYIFPLVFVAFSIYYMLIKVPRKHVVSSSSSKDDPVVKKNNENPLKIRETLPISPSIVPRDRLPSAACDRWASNTRRNVTLSVRIVAMQHFWTWVDRWATGNGGGVCGAIRPSPTPTTRLARARARSLCYCSANPLPFSFIAPAHLKHNHRHDHGHGGVLDLRPFQTRKDEIPTGMGSLPSSPVPIGSGEPHSWSKIPNRRDLVRHGQVLPWFLFDVVYASFFVTNVYDFCSESHTRCYNIFIKIWSAMYNSSQNVPNSYLFYLKSGVEISFAINFVFSYFLNVLKWCKYLIFCCCNYLCLLFK
jgi:hypothetical protein